MGIDCKKCFKNSAIDFQEKDGKQVTPLEHGLHGCYGSTQIKLKNLCFICLITVISVLIVIGANIYILLS